MSREAALQILFQHHFSSELEVDEIFKRFSSHLNLQNDISKFSLDLVKGVLANKNDIDAKINAVSTNWKTSRMSLVDLSIMRLALFESLYYSEAESLSIVLNEALELTKKYSTEEAAKFINGIVDKIWHEERD